MRAIAVTPGQRASARQVQMERPLPGPGQVLVRTLMVGLDGTDAEIDQGLYGEAPPGSDVLVIGHESLGVVEALGPGVTQPAVGDHVVATVRRPDDCINCRAGEYDMCLSGGYRERGIKGMHGFLSEYYVDEPAYLIVVPPQYRQFAVLLEPLSIVEKAVEQCYRIQGRLVWQPRVALVLGAGPLGILATLLLRLRNLTTYTLARSPQDSRQARLVKELGAVYLEARETAIPDLPRQLGNLDIIIEATGNSTVAFQGMGALGTNGVMCLTGVYSGHGRLDVAVDALGLQMVLGNKVVFGSVNANRRHFQQGLRDMAAAEERWPGYLRRLITRIVPLEDFRQALQRQPGDVKVCVRLAEG